MGLEMLEITMFVEEESGTTLPTDDLYECETYGQLVDLVARCLPEECSAESERIADSFLRRQLVERYGIDPAHITRDEPLRGPGSRLDLDQTEHGN